MTRLQEQFKTLMALLGSDDVLPTYRKALEVTFAIVKEALILLWLVLCLVVVLGEWLWNGTIALGRQGRALVERAKDTTSDRVAADTGKVLAEAGANGIGFALDRAKEQLGMPVPHRPTPAPQLELAPKAAAESAAESPAESAAPASDAPSDPADSVSTDSDPTTDA